MDNQYDVAVIGSGPGGYVAAGRSAQVGLKTVLIEKESLGGVCLNWGCIPTKALLECAHVFDLMKDARTYGLTPTDQPPDFKAVVARSRQVADRMSKGVGFLMKQRGVTVISGTASILEPGIIQVDGGAEPVTLRATHIILATGAVPAPLPGVPFDGDRIIHYRDAMTLPEPPPTLTIIGAGAIGMEFADFFRTYGSEVTVIEMMPEILPNEDPEIVRELHRTLRRKKIQTHVSTRVTGVRTDKEMIEIDAEGPRGAITFRSHKMLVATGVHPFTGGMGLEKLGLRMNGRFIHVEPGMRTSVPGIYAIGDIAGPPMLAHKASAEALSCIESIIHPDQPSAVDYSLIPGCTYCKPQVASAGLTEPRASQAGIPVLKGVFPFRANGMSVAMNETEGIVKLLFNGSTKELIGAHILHAHASDLLGELLLALKMKATAHQIAAAVHAHPTLSEAVMEAAAAALGEAVHI